MTQYPHNNNHQVPTLPLSPCHKTLNVLVYISITHPNSPLCSDPLKITEGGIGWGGGDSLSDQNP